LLQQQLIQAQAPSLLITHGVSGSGKTWQTQRLLEQTGAIRVRSDIERQRLPCAQDPAQRYGASAKQQTYDKLLALATIGLKAGYPVIVDATFLQQAERERFHQLALSMHVPFHILHCEAPLSTLQQRIRTRQAEGRDASEADEAVLARQLQGADPLTSAEQACTITLV
jgi:predicted kinase